MVRYAIIENEEFARENLRQTVASLRPGWKLVFTAESVEECIEYFSGEPDADVVFMDIELVDGNCFRIFDQCEVTAPVIFTTAYDDYAVKAFEVNSVHYLMKPISAGALEKALQKYEKGAEAQQSPDYSSIMRALKPPTPARSRILISSGDNYMYLPVEDVAYFIREEKYVEAVRHDGKAYVTDFKNLSEAYAVVDPGSFFQLSRNIVTSIRAVGKVSKWFNGRLRVELRCGDRQETVVVSQSRRQDFLDWFCGAS